MSEKDDRGANGRGEKTAAKSSAPKRCGAWRRFCVAAASVTALTATFADVWAIDFKIPLPTIVDAFKKDVPPNGEANEAGDYDAENDAASTSAPSTFALDLSPSFTKFLPYSVALGKVVCESNFPLEETAGLQAEIVRLQNDLVGYLGVPESTEKISLCLFRDRTSYIAFICEYFPGAPTDRPALYVKEPGKPGVLMVRRDEKMILNVRHEMVHAYLNAALRNVPIWIDEGLAKYFETPPGERGFSNPFLEKVESDATSFFASPPSLSRLERLTRVDQMRIREYRESWAWTHFLIHYSPDTQRVLALYLRSLQPEAQAGISSAEAARLQKDAPLKRLLERYVPDYKAKYVEHFRGWAERRDDYERGERRRRLR
ncbi:MAG: hypothetical protein IJO06_01575 [Thermoguttaceae bacterium]|nr:hypothetical protein [Thermoguttaceae bacterium]